MHTLFYRIAHGSAHSCTLLYLLYSYERASQIKVIRAPHLEYLAVCTLSSPVPRVRTFNRTTPRRACCSHPVLLLLLLLLLLLCLGPLPPRRLYISTSLHLCISTFHKLPPITPRPSDSAKITRSPPLSRSVLQTTAGRTLSPATPDSPSARPCTFCRSARLAPGPNPSARPGPASGPPANNRLPAIPLSGLFPRRDRTSRHYPHGTRSDFAPHLAHRPLRLCAVILLLPLPPPPSTPTQ